MGYLSRTKPLLTVEPLKLLASMYAARQFAVEAEEFLKQLRIGMGAKVLPRDLQRTMEILDERLSELRVTMVPEGPAPPAAR